MWTYREWRVVKCPRCGFITRPSSLFRYCKARAKPSVVIVRCFIEAVCSFSCGVVGSRRGCQSGRRGVCRRRCVILAVFGCCSDSSGQSPCLFNCKRWLHRGIYCRSFRNARSHAGREPSLKMVEVAGNAPLRFFRRRAKLKGLEYSRPAEAICSPSRLRAPPCPETALRPCVFR